MSEDIFKLDMHESKDYTYFRATRVPSGWIYRFWDDTKQEFSLIGTFVPTEK